MLTLGAMPNVGVARGNTNAGGEINMLDPAGYGTVVITKSISIVNVGLGPAGVLVPDSGTGITINAGTTDIINLRGLIIDGAKVGGTRIQFNSDKTLTIENCVVRNLAGNGISFNPTGSSNLAESNTFVADNAPRGIRILPASRP